MFCKIPVKIVAILDHGKRITWTGFKETLLALFVF